MLEATSLAKSYGGHDVFSDVTFVVDAGEIATLLGPNGAGKTTLLSIIASLRRPDSGSVRICGHDLASSRREALDNLGIAPQETSIQLALTGREILTFFAELQGVHKSDVRAQLDWTIESLDLGEFIDRPAQKLSGGERRRIHTGAAIIARPKVVLLDEPTVGADIESRAKLLDAVRGLAANGTAVLYTTHYLPEVDELGGRVLMLDGGRLIADGTIAELLAAHSDDAVELTFDGPITDLADRKLCRATANGSEPGGIVDLEVRGNVVRARGEAITIVTADLLRALGPNDPQLLDINLVGGSLESVYLDLTGHHYDANNGSSANGSAQPELNGSASNGSADPATVPTPEGVPVP